MRLAFSGQGRYTDFSEGYRMYLSRSKSGKEIDRKTYCRVIRLYCKHLAKELEEKGMVDLPGGLGMIATATLTRKPQYRGKKFIGYGAYDWKTNQYDGKLKTFGVVFLPKHNRKKDNLRSFGFVANRRLFQRLKGMYDSGDCPWETIEFNDEMI